MLAAINMSALKASLVLMGQGMVGIFVVMLIISLLVAGVSKLSGRKK